MATPPSAHAPAAVTHAPSVNRTLFLPHLPIKPMPSSTFVMS